MDAAADDSTAPPISTLRRRNSIGPPSTITVPIKQHHPLSTSSSNSSSFSTSAAATTSSSSDDFELISIKTTSYTSLRDILPSPAAAVHSPKTPSTAHPGGYEIPIRNRLVKQAAWAYLQPMSTSPESDGSTLLRRLWTRFSSAFVRLFDCLLHPAL